MMRSTVGHKVCRVSPFCSFEAIYLKLSISNIALSLVVIYRPQRPKILSQLLSDFEELCDFLLDVQHSILVE